MLKISIASATVLLVLSSGAWADDAVDRYYKNKEQVVQAIGEHLNAYFKSNDYFGVEHYDFTKVGANSSRYHIPFFEISYPFGMASVAPRQEARKVEDLDPFLPDGSGFLLKKQNGRWKVLQMGTSFHGAGEKFGVPKRLWKKWRLF